MQWNKIWPVAAVSLIAFSGFAHADNGNGSVDSAKMPHKTGVVNPIAVVADQGDGVGLGLQLEWLYQDVRQDGNEYAVVNSTTNGITTAKSRVVEGDYSSGIRAGLQYQIDDHDDWDMVLEYTHQHPNTFSNSAGFGNDDCGSNGSSDIYPFLRHPATIGLDETFGGIAFDGSIVDSAKGTWSPELDQIDFELGRHFRPAQATWFAIRPFAGLRYAKHKQTLAATYVNEVTINNVTETLTETVSNSSDMSGFGLKFGFDTKWGFTENGDSGLSAYANFAVSLLACDFDTKYSDTFCYTVDGEKQDLPEELVNSDAFAGSISASHDSGKAVVDLAVGLMWHMFFEDMNYGLTLTAGWEHHKWHNMNQFIRPVDDAATYTYARNHGDLAYQGFTFGAKFDF
jgi:hypothetical protein